MCYTCGTALHMFYCVTDVPLEICDTEEFQASCQPHEAVLLLSAKYGRMRMGRCVTSSLGYIGCHKDVLTLADSRCSARRNCQIRVPDATFERTQPCMTEMKSFLEISYTCVKGNLCVTAHDNLKQSVGMGIWV